MTEQPDSQDLERWSNIGAEQLDDTSHKRRDRLANIAYLLAETLSPEQRRALLEGTSLEIGVSSTYTTDEHGRAILLQEFPDNVWIQDTNHKVSRIQRGEECMIYLDRRGGGLVSVVTPKNTVKTNLQDVLDAHQLNREMGVLESKRWMERAEEVLMNRLSDLHNIGEKVIHFEK